MYKVSDIINEVERLAPLTLQEDFDNAGVQVGDITQLASGVLLCLDITEEVLDEALDTGCNLIISHHPLAFKAFKSLTGKSYIERCMIKACKHDLVIYAAHTNLDNAPGGVNHQLADMLGLQKVQVLAPQKHPLTDQLGEIGSGVVGTLLDDIDELSFLQQLKTVFRVSCIKHSPLTGRKIGKVAVCGGSGAFLIEQAIESGADIFITGEARYNDYYNVEDRILLAVVGHYESEVCTKDIFYHLLTKKFPTFAVHFSNVNSKPVKYL